MHSTTQKCHPKMLRRQFVSCLPALACLPHHLSAAVDEKEAAAQSAVERLLDRIIASEQQMMKTISERNPIVETYIQEEVSDEPGAPPARDHYFLGRMVLVDSINYSSFVKRSVTANQAESKAETRSENRLRLKLPFLRKQSNAAVDAPEPVSFLPVGFAQMALIDTKTFDRKTYRFDFVRREFLGEVRCLVFDIAPIANDQPGKFIGRIWVEDQDACIVRANGTYTLRSAEGVYFHFDSWRTQAAPALWIPTVIYVEDSVGDNDRSKIAARFKGQTRIWSYDSQSRRKMDELTTMLVENGSQVQDAAANREESPLEGQRRWEREAETNVLERLEKIGLIAPVGDVDKVLNTVLNNLIVSSDLDLDAQCRLLLTTPLETFTIGHTVVLSRGLIDVLPDEASLALAIAMELAHIALAHPTRTEYAFNDRTMVGDEAVLDKFRFARTPLEVAAAMKKASLMLAKSPYKDKMSGTGLFLRVLHQKSPSFPRLIQPTLGNDLAMYLKTPEFVSLLENAPPIEDSKLEQIAALPLGSRIRLEPWSNDSFLMKTQSAALLSAREKMPFEVAPVNVRLTRRASVVRSAGTGSPR